MLDTSKQTEEEFVCNAVVSVLVADYHIDPETANKMVHDSAFFEILQEDPQHINHRRPEYWAQYILKEYDWS